MKASLKLRQNQDAVLKSKIPLKILGFPFRSSLEASRNAKELCLSFSTAFGYGPLFKLDYRPNDPSNPLMFILKTGVGTFGSPVGAPISINAEFNLLGNRSPRFFLHLKPEMGDIATKQTIVSDNSQSPLRFLHDSNIKREATLATSDKEEQEKMSWTRMLSAGVEAAKSVVGSGEIYARTAVPVRDMAVVNVRWGVSFPATSGEDKKHGDWLKKMPFLVLNKIGIEHVEGLNEAAGGRVRGSREIVSGGDVVEAYLDIKKELGVLRNENEVLKKDFEKFKSEIGGRELDKQTKDKEVAM